MEAYSHPATGDAQRVWAINPDLFGWDDLIVGASVYQPLRFPGQLVDEETTAWVDYGDPARPPLHYNHHRFYDPFTGMYLQPDSRLSDSWSAYGYAENDPVRKIDPEGKLTIQFEVGIGGCPLFDVVTEVITGVKFCARRVAFEPRMPKAAA